MVAGGIVAAGSRATAQAGAEVLARGGNAVDAAVAACLATGAGEPALTSIAGGGVMLYRDKKSGAFTVCDFFANAPGLGAPQDADRDFFPADVDFGPAVQRFHVGRAAAAVPGVIPGLMTALECWGRLPAAEVVAPVCEMLRGGAALSEFQAGTFDLLAPILTHSPATRALYAPQGQLLRAGDSFCNPDLADTLDALASGDWREVYRHEIGGLILRDFGVAAGGLISAADLESYRVEFRQPLVTPYRGATLHLNPPPAAGGHLVGLSLALLEAVPLADLEWGSPEHRRALVAAMRVVEESRGVPGDPFAGDGLARWRVRFDEVHRDLVATAPANGLGGPGHTTHVSVIDGDGCAAAVTFTYGEGAGYVIGDTGIVMNNLMGEQDLHLEGFHRWPAGQRLATGMCPSAVVSPGGDLTVLGTGGSNRIRTALLQVITNLVDFGLPADEAVAAGRVHWEDGVLNAEVHDLPAGRAALAPVCTADDTLVVFDEASLFFGGVHLARRSPDGQLTAAGDPRRDGAVVRVGKGAA